MRDADSVVTWRSVDRLECNSLLRQVFSVYLHGGIDLDDVVYGDLFTRLPKQLLEFLSGYEAQIAFTIDRPFQCVLSKSPLDHLWHGAIKLGSSVGVVTPVTRGLDWYSATFENPTQAIRAHQAVTAELAWLGEDAPEFETTHIGNGVVLVSPRAVETLGQRGGSDDYQRGRRRVMVSWSMVNGVPDIPYLRLVDVHGADDLFACRRVGPDGMWL